MMLMKIVIKIIISLIKKICFTGIIASIAFVINVLLFTLFPLLDRYLQNDGERQKSEKSKRIVLVEYTKEKKEKKKVPPKRIRKIEMNNRRSGQDNNLQMKFTPELSSSGHGVSVATSANMNAVIFNEGETDEELVPVSIHPIPYPDRAKTLGVEGVLVIEIVIGITGKVEEVCIVKSPHSSFDSEVKKQVKKWLFSPAKNKGVPVRVKARKEIEFKLN